MFIDAPDEDGFRHLDPTDTVGVTVGTGSPPPLTYSFAVGPGRAPAATGMNPSTVDLLHLSTSGVFVNTGRHVLFDVDYLFDARAGRVGFQPLAVPLR
jgi:hypothetical protein